MSKDNEHSPQRGCLAKWWHQKYSHQKSLENFLEHPFFHLFIIVLVIVECAAVVIEILFHNLKNQYQCNTPRYAFDQYNHNRIHRLEHIMHICHYLSISILSVFIFELLLKLYAYGYHYWNCKENHKLDYFDAFLAIFSYTIEIYFIFADKDSILAHSAVLIVVLRLWHLLRIANAVARCFQTGKEFKAHRRERRLSKASEALLVPTSIQAVLDLMQEKTECLRRDITVEQSLVDRFEQIDQKLQDAFEDHYGNEDKLVEEIEKLHLITKRINNPKKKYVLAV